MLVRVKVQRLLTGAWSLQKKLQRLSPAQRFFEKDDGYYLISRGCFYDKKFENYVMYLIDGDTLQECLDKYDDVQSTSSP